MDWLTSSSTSLEDIISVLAERDCSNLTYSINLTTCSKQPIAGRHRDVYQGELNSGIKVAIKVLRIYDKPGQADVKRDILKCAAEEIYHWSRLKHQNILPLMGFAVFQGQMSMVSEWMGYGDLRSYVESHPGANRISLCIDVCAGLCYIHEKGMVHGDLEAANVMVSPGGIAILAGCRNSQVKRLVIGSTNATTHGRSIRWMAPELLQKAHHLNMSKEADVYAFGMTALEALTGKEPYQGFTEEYLIVMMTSKYHPPARPTTIPSSELWNSLTQCWTKESSERPTIEDVWRSLRALVAPVGDVDTGEHASSELPGPSRLPPALRRRQRVHNNKQTLQSSPETSITATGKAPGRNARGEAMTKKTNTALGTFNLDESSWLQSSGAKIGQYEESSTDGTINELGWSRGCTAARSPTSVNEDQKTARQNPFEPLSTEYVSRQRPAEREKSAHNSSYTQEGYHQPRFCPRPNYSRTPPPVQHGDGKRTVPPMPPTQGSRSPRTPQPPQSKVRATGSGDYDPVITTAGPLPREAPNPAIEQLPQQSTLAQVYSTRQQRKPTSHPPILPPAGVAPAPSISGSGSSVSHLSIGAHTVPASVQANNGSLDRCNRAYVGLVGDTSVADRMSHSISASERTAHPAIPTQRSTQSLRLRPPVYPALLSRVADAFQERIPLTERTKDGLTYYPVAFDGREAVDLIAHIIKTSDRNLALLLGRALDAQKFFHDVTCDHRLRDSPIGIYQFSAREEKATTELPSGVFTLLTECYSPTCTASRLCYSPGCPRRSEQITRQQSYLPQVTYSVAPNPAASLSGTTITAGAIAASGKFKGNLSNESLIDHGAKLWIHSVPQEVVDSVSDQEKKRQEAINEVINTERDFVSDLEYLRDCWMGPLRTEDVIPPERRTDFVRQVFWNIEDILAISTRLRDWLTRRQVVNPVIETIGDIFSELVPQFRPFIQYGKHGIYGKHKFEEERLLNPAFAEFAKIVERLHGSRKLELDEYLTQPTMRLARYRLLLEVVLEHTPEDNPDRVEIPKVINMVRKLLIELNEESSKAEGRFNLLQLDQKLVFPPGEELDLKLQDERRRLFYQGSLKGRRGTRNQTVDLQVFLLDHALLVTKRKTIQQREQLVVFKRPIPLEFLDVTTPDEEASNRSRSAATGYQFTITHLGRKGYSLVLSAPTIVARRKWVEQIAAQQDPISERTGMFDMFSLSEDAFVGQPKVNCAAPYGKCCCRDLYDVNRVADRGQRIVYGTDAGVYLQSFSDSHSQKPVKAINLVNVRQVDVLEECKLLIVLSERSVLTFPLDILNVGDPMRRMRRISAHTSFFKLGYCLARVLLCVVRVETTSISSTIKILERTDQSVRGKDKPLFKQLVQGRNDTFKVLKEFYIPREVHSIHFLKTKLCVACANGFEIVDLETLDTQALLDPEDPSLEFVQMREDARPVSIYRIDGDFLLCYREFAFYVNKVGRHSKRDLVIYWEGSPTAFVFRYPYIIALEPAFIEIRRIDNGSLVQIIRGNNLRRLSADTHPSTTHSIATLNPPPSSAGSIGSASANEPTPHMATHGHPQQTQQPTYERNEIIIAVENEVMEILLAVPVTEA